MTGAGGGMGGGDNRGPAGKEVGTWEECGRIGRLLAEEALRIVQSAPVQHEPKLACFAKTISFPVDSPMMRKIIQGSPLGYTPSADDQVATQLNVLNVGNAQILTIPVEARLNIGFYLQRRMHARHNLLFCMS